MSCGVKLNDCSEEDEEEEEGEVAAEKQTQEVAEPPVKTETEQVEGSEVGDAEEGAEPASSEQPAKKSSSKKRTESTELEMYSPDELRGVDKEVLNAEISQLEGQSAFSLIYLSWRYRSPGVWLTRLRRGHSTYEAQPERPGRIPQTRGRIPRSRKGHGERHGRAGRRETAVRRSAESPLGRVHGWFHGHQRQAQGDVPGRSASAQRELLRAERILIQAQMITMGGNAEIELIDSMDPFSEGVVLSIMPPKKSWRAIANLSGGEKVCPQQKGLGN